VFLAKFFPLGKTYALCGIISSLQQIEIESHPESLGKAARIHLNLSLSWMDEWLVHQSFYNGLR
jgi:hypothetical protein